jgi:hypothetical protein
VPCSSSAVPNWERILFEDAMPPPIRGVDGLTWHHHPTRPGVLQLIPRAHHKAKGPVQKSLHPDGRGGMQNWGGGR